MSTPAIWNETFKIKASRYTRAEAEAAIADCHAALKTNPEASASYVMKTWCEIDAMRARIAELAKGRKVAPLERELLAELRNIAEAKRFNRAVFSDDTAFADWAQSRARHAIRELTGDDSERAGRALGVSTC